MQQLPYVSCGFTYYYGLETRDKHELGTWRFVPVHGVSQISTNLPFVKLVYFMISGGRDLPLSPFRWWWLSEASRMEGGRFLQNGFASHLKGILGSGGEGSGKESLKQLASISS